MSTGKSLKSFKQGVPRKDKFSNQFTNEAISNNNHEHILNIWETFRMKIIENCHDLSLEISFLLLVCMFETFRKEPINPSEFDPTHYLTTPGSSWEPLIKFIDVNSKLTLDVEKYQFIEKMIRGGISMICQEYVGTNN